ncbi:unnamed protein product [Pleuronectes platessa]|uniref:Uncharacterized protein n=1 Tax=Pleuronectes platessa TaxID=8262 RepID=A0A9N7VR38_PLEPL|nr:unnamed protein product [Pleuronectes platessa]
MAACAATASRNRKSIVRENFTLNMARKKLPALCVRRTRCRLVLSSERLQPGRTSGPDPLNTGPLVGPAYSRAGRAGWRTRTFEEEEESKAEGPVLGSRSGEDGRTVPEQRKLSLFTAVMKMAGGARPDSCTQ